MLARLILLFVTVPLVELALLIWVGNRIGPLMTVALVIGTGILGATLARLEGLATLRRFQNRMDAGELPHQDIIDGLLILLAGAVLLTPGLLTDTVGFLLLVPPVRALVRGEIFRRLEKRFLRVPPGVQGVAGPDVRSAFRGGGVAPGGFAGYDDSRPDVVDAEYTVIEDSLIEEDVD
jgi:UPF0716 protein FxsA